MQMIKLIPLNASRGIAFRAASLKRHLSKVQNHKGAG